jgi:hypothetical protein
MGAAYRDRLAVSEPGLEKKRMLRGNAARFAEACLVFLPLADSSADTGPPISSTNTESRNRPGLSQVVLSREGRNAYVGMVFGTAFL